MPSSIAIYYALSQFEPACKYYMANEGLLTQATAESLLNAMKPLQCIDIAYTRWEGFDADGLKVEEGALSGYGSAGGQTMPFTYALLLRLLSVQNVKRPSVKYIHGFSEDFTQNGRPTSEFLARVAVYGIALSVAGVVDSDGGDVTGAVFRTFTRRRRVRRLTI